MLLPTVLEAVPLFLQYYVLPWTDVIQHAKIRILRLRFFEALFPPAQIGCEHQTRVRENRQVAQRLRAFRHVMVIEEFLVLVLSDKLMEISVVLVSKFIN